LEKSEKTGIPVIPLLFTFCFTTKSLIRCYCTYRCKGRTLYDLTRN